ncbi:unnamed protein product [Urochloa humidicola]
MTEGTHKGDNIDFYGLLREVIELQYNSNLQFRWSVVLFRCAWYNQEGKTVGLRYDDHFKSINIKSVWYKSNPFILATQSRKIFYFQDNLMGKDWRVVQKFEHRDMYNVPEWDADVVVHQDKYYSDTKHVMHEGAADDDMNQEQPVEDEDLIIDGNLTDLISNKKQGMISQDSSEDEDESDDQYCSDSDNEKSRHADSEEEDDL